MTKRITFCFFAPERSIAELPVEFASPFEIRLSGHEIGETDLWRAN